MTIPANRTFVLFCMSLTAMAGEQTPKLRLSEVQAIAPSSYRVDLTLDPDKPEIKGVIEIKLDVRKPAQMLWLNASKIEIQEAALKNGVVAHAIPGGDDFVGLRFDSPIPAGSADLTIRYTGIVKSGDTSGVFQTEDAGNHYILTQFESTDARDAYPCFDEPNYKVPWQLTLHIPAQDKAVSNTPILSDKVDGAMRTVVFKETKPLPSYLVAFGVGPFEFVPAGYAGKNRVPVRIVTPKGKAEEARYAAEVTATVLTRLEDYFGIPYPYEKSDQVAVPVTLGFGAMENAGMVTYGQNIILTKPSEDNIERQRGYAATAAHELSHQWFGDLVTTEWWNDLWLNEAFATWMQQKIISEWHPDWSSRLQDVDTKLYAEYQDGRISARKIRQPIENKGDIGNAFDAITYQKGAAVIAMFENWMGPEQFRTGVQTYLKHYAFRNATAPEFLDSLSSAGGKSVTQPFSTFLNQAGVPMLSVALDCAHNSPTLHLEQSRYLPIGSKGSSDQVWQIPVCVRYGTGTDPGKTECTLINQSKTDVALTGSKGCPEWVQANDNAKGYYVTNYHGDMMAPLVHGDVTARLSGPERVDFIGNILFLAGGGKLQEGDALRMAEFFNADPARSVVETALIMARAPEDHLVPKDLVPNYRRYLQKCFGAKAHELGWIPNSSDSDDARLLRPDVVGMIASSGGDRELADQARGLADKWLLDHTSVSSDVAAGILETTAYYGDRALFERYLAEFLKTQSRPDKEKLASAMTRFRDPTAVNAALEAVLSKKISLAEGYPLLMNAGVMSAETRKMRFEFVKAHFDEITKGNPSIFGFELGSSLPFVGEGLCDAQSRDDLEAFFKPKTDKYAGSSRNLAQTLEGIDLCIALKQAQEPSVAEFLRKY